MAKNTYLKTPAPRMTTKQTIKLLFGVAMRNPAFQMNTMCNRNKGGSHATQATRPRHFSTIAKAMEELGFRNLDIKSLKPKHVETLVAHWKEQGLSVGPMKNLMTAVRYWAAYIGKENVVKPSNCAYGIDDRVYVTNESKATEVTMQQLSLITDPSTRISLRLEEVFGLRREESIKIKPQQADPGDRLRLKDSWTKGRQIPRDPHQHRQAGSRTRQGEGACGEGQSDPEIDALQGSDQSL